MHIQFKFLRRHLRLVVLPSLVVPHLVLQQPPVLLPLHLIPLPVLFFLLLPDFLGRPHQVPFIVDLLHGLVLFHFPVSLQLSF